MNHKSEFFKTGPCGISYKGELVGVTLDSPLLNIEPKLYESKSNQIGNKSVCKIITNMRITVSANVKEIAVDFANFFDDAEEISDVILGDDVLITGGNLCLSPVSRNDKISYCFPKAVLISEAVHACKNSKEHYLKMNFEVYEDFEGVLMEKYSTD